jgi:hypothetical protein
LFATHLRAHCIFLSDSLVAGHRRCEGTLGLNIAASRSLFMVPLLEDQAEGFGVPGPFGPGAFGAFGELADPDGSLPALSTQAARHLRLDWRLHSACSQVVTAPSHRSLVWRRAPPGARFRCALALAPPALPSASSTTALPVRPCFALQSARCCCGSATSRTHRRMAGACRRSAPLLQTI